MAENQVMIEMTMDAGTAEMYRFEAMGVELVNTMVARAGLPGTTSASQAVGPGFL